MQWKCLNCDTINESTNSECEVCGYNQTEPANEIVLPEEINQNLICTWLQVGNFEYLCLDEDVIRVKTQSGVFFIGHDRSKELILIDTHITIDNDDVNEINGFKRFVKFVSGKIAFFSMTIGDPFGVGSTAFTMRHTICLEGGIPSKSILTTFQKSIHKVGALRFFKNSME